MRGRTEEAIANLAFLRRRSLSDPELILEFAEIEAAVEEEREARKGLGFKEAFLAPGNRIRFIIAFVIFLLQQFSGQNSVNYYAPLIFQVRLSHNSLLRGCLIYPRLAKSIGYSSIGASLLASGVYGIVKVVATSIFILFFVDLGGRRWSLFISSMGMGILFYIIGAILKTHPPIVGSGSPAPASKAMAGLLYIYVCFYSMGSYRLASLISGY